MKNSSLLQKAKELKEALQKRYDKVTKSIQEISDQDELENLSYAIGHMSEVIEALECNE
jgi:hypothetical protein